MVARFKKTKKRTSWQTILISAILGMLTLGLIAFLAVSNLRINKKRQAMEEEINGLREKIEILQERKESLEAGLLQSQEEGYREEKIREQGYKKPGEEVIAVLREPSIETREEVRPEEKEESFWEQIWQKLEEIK